MERCLLYDSLVHESQRASGEVVGMLVGSEILLIAAGEAFLIEWTRRIDTNRLFTYQLT